MKWLITLLMLPALVLAQEQPTQTSPEALQPAKVEAWLNAAQALQQWGEQNHVRGQGFFNGELGKLSEQMMQQLRQQGIYDDVRALLLERGFSSPEKWAEVGQRIITAMGAVVLGQQTPKYIAALEKLQASPDISAQAKEALTENLRLVQQLNSSFQSVSDADKRAVTPYIDRYRALAKQTADRAAN